VTVSEPINYQKLLVLRWCAAGNAVWIVRVITGFDDAQGYTRFSPSLLVPPNQRDTTTRPHLSVAYWTFPLADLASEIASSEILVAFVKRFVHGDDGAYDSEDEGSTASFWSRLRLRVRDSNGPN
jgi:hypothetical protein